MGRIAALIGKDFIQILRDWKAFMFLLIMPVVFTLFFGLVFGGTEQEDFSPVRIPMEIINQDPQGIASQLLVRNFLQDDKFDAVLAHTEDSITGHSRKAEEKNRLVITIPKNFTTRLFEGTYPKIDILPMETEEPSSYELTAVEAEVEKIHTAAAAGEAAAAVFPREEKNADRRGDLKKEKQLGPSGAERVAFLTAYSYLQEKKFELVQEYVKEGKKIERQPVGFEQSSPGMIVQFAIFGLITSAMVLLLERKSGALQRLLATPFSKAGIIGGHLMAMFLIVFLQELLLVLLGQFIFKVPYFSNFPAVITLMLSLALWASSLGLFIGSIARKEEQVITLSLIFMFIFAALGGAWFPLEVAGKTFATIGHLFPSAWAMDGFQDIILRGRGFVSIIPSVGFLLGYAAVFFCLGVWRFRLKD